MKGKIAAAVPAALAGLALALAGAPAQAQFLYGGVFETTMQADGNFGAGKNGVTLFNESDFSFFAGFGPLQLIGNIKLEQLRVPRGSSAFAGEAAYIETLYLEYSADPVTLFAGKIHPRFGWGWDKLPGLYGTDMAEDYELSERVGAGVTLETAGVLGRHDLTVESFFLDTTLFSHALGSHPARNDPRTDRPWRLRRSDGGPSNSGDFSSFAVTLTGKQMPGLDYLEYRLSYERQAKGRGDLGNEHGLSLALALAEIPLSARLSATPLIEIVWLDNAFGTRQNARYISIGNEFAYGRWTATGALTLRRMSGASAPRANDSQVTASLGYDLSSDILPGLGIELGWKHLREEHRSTETVGIAITWEKRF